MSIHGMSRQEALIVSLLEKCEEQKSRIAELEASEARLRDALKRYVTHCHRCYGSGRELLNDDDPEAGGTVCLTCRPARAALEVKP